jgi:cytochrome b
MDAPEATRHLAAWDLPVRLFHWTLAVLVLAQWATFEYAETLGDVTLDLHRAGGLAVLVLLVWRILWGFAGSSTARFSSFVRSPAAAARYGADLAAGRTRHFLGHNPLGGLMVLALIAVLLMQTGFGLFAVDDNDLTGGPLHRLVSEHANGRATVWHRRVFEYAILPLVAVHVAANLLYGLVRKEPLIRAMITGDKPMAAYEDAPAAVMPRYIWLRAVLCLAAAAGLVLGGIAAAGGRF